MDLDAGQSVDYPRKSLATKIAEITVVMAKTAKILGAVLALALLLLAYNVARHLVFWGSTETVSFPSGDLSIAWCR